MDIQLTQHLGSFYFYLYSCYPCLLNIFIKSILKFGGKQEEVAGDLVVRIPEQINCDAVAAEALASLMESSEARMAPSRDVPN